MYIFTKYFYIIHINFCDLIALYCLFDSQIFIIIAYLINVNVLKSQNRFKIAFK